MKLKELKNLYPSAEVKKQRLSDQKYFYLPLKNGWFRIPKKDISEKEQQLLALFAEPETELDEQQHPWAAILFGQGTVTQDAYYRILQIQLSKAAFPLKDRWLTELQQLLPNSVDAFFIDSTTVLFIEQRNADCLDLQDFEGIFLALDHDFDISTRLFIGSFHAHDHDFSVLFAEEQRIFSECGFKQKCLDIAKAAVTYYSQQKVQDSYLLQALYLTCLKNSDMLEVIPVLWRNLGNISSTSKDLFMHRNTLLYKIDKFYSETLLNLKDSNGLFLCYLLVENFSSR